MCARLHGKIKIRTGSMSIAAVLYCVMEQFFIPQSSMSIAWKAVGRKLFHYDKHSKHRKNCKRFPVPFLIVRSQLTRIVFVIVVIVVVCVFVIGFLGGQVLSPHHYEQMSQRSEVSEITIKISSLNVFKPGCNILFFYLIEFSEYEVKLRMAEDEALEDTMIDIVEVVCNFFNRQVDILPGENSNVRLINLSND